MAIRTVEPRWEEDFNLELEGTRGLRVLVYEEDAKQVTILRGKAEIEVFWLFSHTFVRQVSITFFSV